MSFEINTANNYIDLLDRLDTFLTTNGKAFDPTFTGVGNGTISAWDGTPTSVAETWTITATSATNFTVAGSVSGALADATVGTPYTNARIGFTLTAGTTPFSVGDVFKINTCPKWTRMTRATSSVTGQPYIVWKAPGNDGTKEIYMGASCVQDTGADYYNIFLTWLTGYDAGATHLLAQPGALNAATWINPYVGLWNASLPYWFCANGQMFRLCAKVSNVYQHAYLGFLRTYLSPNAHPFPMFCGGSHGYLTGRRFSDTTLQTHAYWRGYNTNDLDTKNRHSGLFRMPTGNVLGMVTMGSVVADQVTYLGFLYPWMPFGTTNNTCMLNQRECLDGSYMPRPIVIIHDPTGDYSTNAAMLGEFDGVYAVPGYAQTAENTVTKGQITHVVFPNVFNTAQDQYCAFALN